MIRPVALVLLALLMAPVDGADVYRCVTGNGVVRYASTPCEDGEVKKLAIESEPTNVSEVRERAEQRETRISAIEEAEAKAEKAAAEAAKKEEERKQACAAARERLEELMIARRVTVGEGESKRYLESEEIVQHRQDARNDVNKLCTDR